MTCKITEIDKNRIKAESRVKELKKFYDHIAAYLIINFVFTLISNYYDIVVHIYGDFRISNKITTQGFDYYPLWIIWGVFLAMDAFRIFGFVKLFGRKWEEKKLKEFINKEVEI